MNFTEGTGILAEFRLGNGIWAKIGLGKWDSYPLQDPPFTLIIMTSAGWQQ